MPNPEHIEVSRHRTIEIVVQTTRGEKNLSVPKFATIAEVIKEAVGAFEFQPGDNFELVLKTKPGDPLRREETLDSYRITDGEVLILTAVGGGV